MFPLLLRPPRAAGLETTRAARLLDKRFHGLLVGVTANPFLPVSLTSLIENFEGNALHMDLGTGAVAATLDHYRRRPLDGAERTAKAAG